MTGHAEQIAAVRHDVASIHHFHGDDCLCGFSSSRSRSRTEHILDAFIAAQEGGRGGVAGALARERAANDESDRLRAALATRAADALRDAAAQEDWRGVMFNRDGLDLTPENRVRHRLRQRADALDQGEQQPQAMTLSHDRLVLRRKDAGTDDAVVLVRCPHTIGLCFRLGDGHLGLLPCPCNDPSEVLAELVPERGGQHRGNAR